MTGEPLLSTEIAFDAAEWRSRPGTPRAPDDLKPRDGVIAGPQVNLSWRDNGMDDGNPSVNFKIEVWRIANGGRGDRVWDSDWQAETSRGWVAPGPGEYEWIVRAGNGAGQSAASSPARFVVPLLVPQAPSDLRLQTATPSGVSMVWQDNSSNEAGFKVERRIGTGGGTGNGTGEWEQIAELPQGTELYNDEQVELKNDFVYRVCAFNNSGNSEYSNELSVAIPYPLASLSLSPAIVEDGESTLATVSLSGPAPAEGVEIALRCSNDAAVTVPATVIVPEGETLTTFPVETVSGVSAKVRITARLHEVEANADLTINSLTAPDNLTATVNEEQVTLRWRDNAIGESGTKIERLSEGRWSEIARGTTPDQQSYIDETVALGATYAYRVRAYKAGVANGEASNVVTVTIPALTLAPPADLTVSTSQARLKLRWSDNAIGESGYKVERLDADGRWVEIGRGTTPNQTSYFDADVRVGSTYSYRVRAYRTGVANGEASNIATATHSDATLVAPSGLTAVQVAGRQQVELRWSDNSIAESGTKVERLQSGASRWIEIARGTTPNQQSYIDSTVALGTSYSYRVRAYQSGVANSDASNVATVTLSMITLAPSIDLTATAYGNRIALQWSDIAVGESGIKVERMNNESGQWIQIARTVLSDQTSYVDDDVVMGLTYFYRVRAYTSGVASGEFSNTASAFLSLELLPPTDLTARLTSDRQAVTLSWNDIASGESGYLIERRAGAAGQWAELARGVMPNQQSYVDGTIEFDVAYSYRVRAYEADGDTGEASAIATVTRVRGVLEPVRDLSAKSVDGQVVLQWTDIANDESGYKVERSISGSNRWKLLARGDVPNQNSYADADVTAGASYDYRVRPYKSGLGNGEASNVVSVTVSSSVSSAIQARATSGSSNAPSADAADSTAAPNTSTELSGGHS